MGLKVKDLDPVLVLSLLMAGQPEVLPVPEGQCAVGWTENPAGR